MKLTKETNINLIFNIINEIDRRNRNINFPNNSFIIILHITELYIKCQENNNLINNLLEREKENRDFWIFKNIFIQTFTGF